MRASGSQAILAILAPAFASCASVEQALIEQGQPPAYAAGYADGCASGKEAAGGLFADARKDQDRYGADSQYTQGWDEGFEECRRDMTAMVLDARRRDPSRED